MIYEPDSMKHNIPTDLIFGHLRGGNSPAEENMFEAWLSLKGNKAIYDEIVARWNDIRCEYDFGCGTEAAWENIASQLKIESQGRYAVRRIALRSALAIAAALIISVISIFTFNVLSGPQFKTPVCFNNGIGKSTIALPDGTKVTLNANSSISYVHDFGKKERRVSCNGRVFFDVEKDASKPFIIDVDGLQIKVTGTSFDVDSRHENVVVSLVEGSVELSSDKFEGVRNMQVGDIASFDKNRGTIALKNGDTSRTRLWCADHLSFSGAPLDRVCADLSEWYGIDVIVSDKLKSKGAITFTITNEPLDVVLSIISKTTSVDYRYEGNHTVIIF